MEDSVPLFSAVRPLVVKEWDLASLPCDVHIHVTGGPRCGKTVVAMSLISKVLTDKALVDKTLADKTLTEEPHILCGDERHVAQYAATMGSQHVMLVTAPTNIPAKLEWVVLDGVRRESMRHTCFTRQVASRVSTLFVYNDSAALTEPAVCGQADIVLLGSPTTAPCLTRAHWLSAISLPQWYALLSAVTADPYRFLVIDRRPLRSVYGWYRAPYPRGEAAESKSESNSSDSSTSPPIIQKRRTIPHVTCVGVLALAHDAMLHMTPMLRMSEAMRLFSTCHLLRGYRVAHALRVPRYEHVEQHPGGITIVDVRWTPRL